MTQYLQSSLEPWLLLLAEDPMLRLLQISMIAIGSIGVFLVFFTTRDIILRTNSFPYMFLSIVIVAVIPIVGFLIYLLIRPPRTLKQRELEDILLKLLGSKSTSKSAAKSTSKTSTKPSRS